MAARRLTSARYVTPRTTSGNGNTPPPPRPDTSVTATCPECRARFISIADRSAEDNLQSRVADRHAPKPKPTGTAEIDREQAVERVTEEISRKIADRSLKAGRSLSIAGLVIELGTTRTRVEAAIGDLVKVGTLTYGRHWLCKTLHNLLIRTPLDADVSGQEVRREPTNYLGNHLAEELGGVRLEAGRG